jgi:hypothetical protein
MTTTSEQLRELIDDLRAQANVYSLLSLASKPDEQKAAKLAEAFAKFLRKLDDRLSGMAAVPGGEWISVTERMPTEKRDYLIYYANYREQTVSEFLPEEDPPGFWHGDPTHWRELPAAPEPPHV